MAINMATRIPSLQIKECNPGWHLPPAQRFLSNALRHSIISNTHGEHKRM